MPLDNFLLQEFKSDQEAVYDFWADEQGNLMIDINDKEEIKSYIKRKADKLNAQYKRQLNGSDITKISVPEIINRLSWSHITLYGKHDEIYLNKKKSDIEIEKKTYEIIVYTRARIRTDLPINPNKKLQNKNLERLIFNLKKIYPNIERIKVIGANDNSFEYFLG